MSARNVPWSVLVKRQGPEALWRYRWFLYEGLLEVGNGYADTRWGARSAGRRKMKAILRERKLMDKPKKWSYTL